jgi:tripartite-type tricarboxylate transporter receptor subunit TctC
MTPTFQRRTLLAAGAAALAAPALAQGAWPSKPVTIVVPFPPGGGTDAFARPLFAHDQAQGKQFVIDNKGGAGGTLGAGIAARRPRPTATPSSWGRCTTPSRRVYPKLDYNLESDFVPGGPAVQRAAGDRRATRSACRQRTLPELLEYLRKNPGKLNYGSAGNGTSHHLAGELFKLQTKTFITHIPYRGAGPALQDLVAGQVDLMFDGLGSSAQHIKLGRIRAIAQAADKPAPGFGDVPLAKAGGAPHYRGGHLVRHVGAQGHAARGGHGDAERDAQGAQRRRAQGRLDQPWHRDAQPLGRRFRQVRLRRDPSLVRGGEGLGGEARLMGIRFERAGADGIATVTLANPAKLNAMSAAMWRALRNAFTALAADPGDTRVVLVSGEGGQFASGGDIEEYPAFRLDTATLARFHEQDVMPALVAMRDCELPMVAQVDGVCIGGGLEIAACCDIRICGASSRFGVPIARLGFPMAPAELLYTWRDLDRATAHASPTCWRR